MMKNEKKNVYMKGMDVSKGGRAYDKGAGIRTETERLEIWSALRVQRELWSFMKREKCSTRRCEWRAKQWN